MALGVELADGRDGEVADGLRVLLLDPARVLLGEAGHLLEALIAAPLALGNGDVFEALVPLLLVEVEEHVLLVLVLAVVDDHRVVVLVQAAGYSTS